MGLAPMVRKDLHTKEASLCRVSVVEMCGAVALYLLFVTDVHAQGSAVMCDHYAHNLAQQRSAQGQMLGGAATGSLLGLGVERAIRSIGSRRGSWRHSRSNRRRSCATKSRTTNLCCCLPGLYGWACSLNYDGVH